MGTVRWVLAGLLAASTLAPGVLAAGPATAATGTSCGAGTVLLLGSYPAEVSLNLDAMVLDAAQPTTLSGHDFYAGTLDGHRVITAIAGPSPALATSTTLLGLDHFTCVTAIVYSGTAGGDAPADLGDVTVPSRWTGDEGKTWTPIAPDLLALASATATAAAAKFETLAAVNDGSCSCSGTVAATPAVPLTRVPRVVIGGDGVSFGGDSDTCTADGGELGGCNPCPPCPDTAATPASAGTAASGSTTASGSGAVLPRLSPLAAADAAAPGGLIDVPASAGTHASAPAGTIGNSSLHYLADDQQTTGAQAAATERKVPFIAFRGVSDTASVGDAWPAEYAVYQGLAADNSAIAARAWIGAWSARTLSAPATTSGATRARASTTEHSATRPAGRAAVRPVRRTHAAAPAGTLAYTGLAGWLPWAGLLLGAVGLAWRRRNGPVEN